MRDFDIVKKNCAPDSFRTKKLTSDFGVQLSHADEHFKGSIDIPEKW